VTAAEAYAEKQFQLLLKEGWCADQDALILFDFDRLNALMAQVRSAFPAHAQHAVAIKTNPLLKVLAHISKAGFGLEAASWQELLMAKKADPEALVFWDSPAKTVKEIAHSAAISNLTINIDSWEELKRHAANPCAAHYNLRINPETGENSTPLMNVAGSDSKFGVSIREEERILKSFDQYPFLSGLHVHSSSQSWDQEKLVEGIARVFGLSKKLNRSITTFNIGGGLPYDFENQKSLSVEDYAHALRKRLPEFFSTQITLQSEFGRYYHASCGITYSRVEYVKGQNLILHVGADLFMRECYQPSVWPHRITVHTADGRIKRGESTAYNLCGPLCFGGDVIARKVALPKVEGGDWLAIHDTGANSFALWSRHCSRPMPRMVGTNQHVLSLLKEKESDAEIENFWV
jgi:diaminopimelate decarboxylase